MEDTPMYLFTFLVKDIDVFKFYNGVSGGYASIDYNNKKLISSSIHYIRKINIFIFN
ncbi:MAG: hypothetical protein U0M80_02955 [Fusobacterium mortiferum]